MDANAGYQWQLIKVTAFFSHRARAAANAQLIGSFTPAEPAHNLTLIS